MAIKFSQDVPTLGSSDAVSDKIPFEGVFCVKGSWSVHTGKKAGEMAKFVGVVQDQCAKGMQLVQYEGVTGTFTPKRGKNAGKTFPKADVLKRIAVSAGKEKIAEALAKKGWSGSLEQLLSKHFADLTMFVRVDYDREFGASRIAGYTSKEEYERKIKSGAAHVKIDIGESSEPDVADFDSGEDEDSEVEVDVDEFEAEDEEEEKPAKKVAKKPAKRGRPKKVKEEEAEEVETEDPDADEEFDF